MAGHKVRLGLVVVLCGLLAGGGVRAQSPAPSDGAIDPPSRVGRLSEVEGTVSFHTPDQDQWSPAMINYPVTGGSSFWTEPNARAALEVGPASIRMASQTAFDVVALDDHNFPGQIGQRAANPRLFAPPGRGARAAGAGGPVAEAPRWVSPETRGYQDLGAEGAWTQPPSDGPVWSPANMPADWAPYRHGHWAYVEPWGWTWIDDASWGFAPFHYGRWARDHDRWGWYPGAVVERPVYAPALVAFVGEPPDRPG